MSELRDDVLGGAALAEDDAAEAVADRDGVALVLALRVSVVRALRGVAGAVCEPGVFVAVLAPGAGAWGEGGGVTPAEIIDALGNAAAQIVRVQLEFARHEHAQMAGMVTHLEQARKHLELVFQTCCDLEP